MSTPLWFAFIMKINLRNDNINDTGPPNDESTLKGHFTHRMIVCGSVAHTVLRRVREENFVLLACLRSRAATIYGLVVD